MEGPVTNDSNWMPGLFKDRGPLKPDAGMPVCLGLGDHCLQLCFKAWLSVAKNTTNS